MIKKIKTTDVSIKKKESTVKDGERAHDSSAIRGFTTDQQINIEQLSVQKMSCVDRKNEAVMFNLAIQESALARQVDLAEQRAKLRCKQYDENNIHWKKADENIKKHEAVMNRISRLNCQMEPVSYESTPKVSEFLNENSPRKKDSVKRNSDGIITLDSDSSEDKRKPAAKKRKACLQEE